MHYLCWGIGKPYAMNHDSGVLWTSVHMSEARVAAFSHAECLQAVRNTSVQRRDIFAWDGHGSLMNSCPQVVTVTEALANQLPTYHGPNVLNNV